MTERKQTWGDVVFVMLCAAQVPPERATARTLVVIATKWPQAFPYRLSEHQAQYMLDHPDEIAGDITLH